MAQVQCPNCGGYKTIRPSPYGEGAIVLFLFGVPIILVGLLMSWGVFIVGVVMFCAGLLVNHNDTKYQRTHYKCQICGKEWETPG
jgi:predicted RNA-binding Zn-ribbon protein involved in translation (DUF1610 family)